MTREERSPPIDRETFRRFQAGSEEAALTIVTAFQDRLLGFLYIQTGSRDAAEDIAQEVFLAAYEQRRTIRGERQLKAWLFSVASRKAWRYRRSTPRSISTLHDEDEPAAEPSHTVETLAQRQLHQLLHEALEILSDRDRELVMMRYFGEMPLREVAEALGMPMGSVGVTLGRALARMRHHLEQRGLSPLELLP